MKFVRVNVSLNAGLLRRIDRAAEQEGMTRSAYLAAGARLMLERRGVPPPDAPPAPGFLGVPAADQDAGTA